MKKVCWAWAGTTRTASFNLIPVINILPSGWILFGKILLLVNKRKSTRYNTLLQITSVFEGGIFIYLTAQIKPFYMGAPKSGAWRASGSKRAKKLGS